MDLSTSLDSLLRNGPVVPSEASKFLSEMKRTPSGALVTSKLLATKIQCGSENGAIQAFDFIEAALNCETEGSIEFRTEIGRYRFLNEIIRILSPKYLAEQTPQRVKDRAVQFLQEAAGSKKQRWFPSEHSKIVMVYDSLVKSDIIQQPVSTEAAAEAELQKSVFDRADNAVLLKKLLTSKDPNDLKAANYLIKKLVDQEAERNERRAELHSLLDRIDTSTSLLRDMVSQSTIEWDVVDELAGTCRGLREKLGSVATETSEEASALLQASENIEDVVQVYEDRKAGGDAPLVDTDLVDSVSLSTTGLTSDVHATVQSCSLADDLLGSLGLNDLVKPEVGRVSVGDGDDNGLLLNFDHDEMLTPTNASLQPQDVAKAQEEPKEESKKGGGFNELEILSQQLIQQSLHGNGVLTAAVDTQPKKADKLTLRQMQETSLEAKTKSKSPSISNPLNHNVASQATLAINNNPSNDFMDLSFLEKRRETPSSVPKLPEVEKQQKPTLPPIASPVEIPKVSPDSSTLLVSNLPKELVPEMNQSTNLSQIKSIDLDNVIVSETLQPVELRLEVMDGKQDVNVVASFGQYPDLPRTGVIVFSLSNRNSKDQLVNYVFQLIPPKGLHIKLFAPSSMELPPWKKTFLPPSSLTQVCLVSLPLNASVSIEAKYILSYCFGDDTHLHNGTLAIPHDFS